MDTAKGTAAEALEGMKRLRGMDTRQCGPDWVPDFSSCVFTNIKPNRIARLANHSFDEFLFIEIGPSWPCFDLKRGDRPSILLGKQAPTDTPSIKLQPAKKTPCPT